MSNDSSLLNHGVTIVRPFVSSSMTLIDRIQTHISIAAACVDLMRMQLWMRYNTVFWWAHWDASLNLFWMCHDKLDLEFGLSFSFGFDSGVRIGFWLKLGSLELSLQTSVDYYSDPTHLSAWRFMSMMWSYLISDDGREIWSGKWFDKPPASQ